VCHEIVNCAPLTRLGRAVGRCWCGYQADQAGSCESVGSPS
jgi:hypothetical protein